MSQCEYCKKNIPDDTYRCDVCHFAYSRGFDNGETSARREIGNILWKCLDASDKKGVA